MTGRRRAKLARRLSKALAGVILSVLVGGFAAAALVRYSPGFDVDDNAWNPQISEDTARAIHARRESENSLPEFYFRYLRSAVRGDLGRSRLFETPVADLLKERAAVTLRLIAWGIAGGMLLGALLAWLAVWPNRPLLEMGAASGSAILIAVPPAVVALGFFFAEAPLGMAFSLAIAPRVFGAMRAIARDLYSSPALLAARARGVSAAAITLRYVLRPAAPQIAALTGVALVLAFGASIPIEALCDVPGIGQLAWKAALGRDLPVLCGLALFITLFVTLVEAIGELITGSGELETAS